MRIGSIMWASTQIISLIEAAKAMDFVDLKVWSMNDLEDKDKKSQCLKTLRNQDVLFLYPSNNSVWEEIEPQIKKIGQSIPIICFSAEPALLSISTVTKEVIIRCHQYLTMGGIENLGNMLKFIGRQILGLKIEVDPPKEMPWEGIYHPDADFIFSSVEEYLSWYPYRGRQVVGILFYRSYWINKNLEVEDALIHELEKQGLGVLPVFSHSVGKTDFNSKASYEVVNDFFFDKQGKPRIDAFINLQSFFLVSESEDENQQDRVNKGIDLLVKLDVPVFHPIVSYYKTEEEWQNDHHGIGDSVGWQVSMPEFEGMIEPIIIGAVKRELEPTVGTTLIRYVPIKDRIERAVNRVKKWIELKKKKPPQRKVAFILNNPACVGVELSVGSGSKLDTLESVARIMKKMEESGYHLENPPEDGKELIANIMDRKAISEFRWTTVDEIIKKGGALALLDKEEYLKWFNTFPQKVRERMSAVWGKPPGEEKDGVPAAMVYDGKIVITGVQYGNVVICCQPKRGCAGSRCDGRVCKILHDPEIPPPHQYLATYHYLEKKFGADAIINVGTHGSQEFLPGKSVGLSKSCYPDLAIDNLPYLYIYNADNPAEGTIAKRRGPATLVDHMQTVVTESGLYEHLEKLGEYLQEYTKVKDFAPAREHILKHEILNAIKDAKLEGELKLDDRLPFEEIVKRAHEVITRIRDTQIPDGMHIFGEYPEGERRVDFIHSILRYDFGDGISSRRILFNLMDEGLDFAVDNPASFSAKHEKTYGQLLRDADTLSKKLIEKFLENPDIPPEVLTKEILGKQLKNTIEVELLCTFKRKVMDIAKRIDSSTEIESLLAGFGGSYIQPGPSGLITRGRPDVLPTGRNFYSLDPEKIPTKAAWKVGVKMAEALVEKHRQKTGKFPENLAMVWFSSDIMRADGEEMSQLLYLIGTRPVWQDNGKVRGFEIIPLKELNRPRIDITVRVSGITRDCFPNCIDLLDEAIQVVAGLPESIEDNFIRKHALQQIKEDGRDEISKNNWRDATLRLFASRPGTYGSGVNLAVYASAWKAEKDLSDVFIYWNGYAYGKGIYGKESHQRLINQLASVDLTFNNTCSDESDLFSCCCYFSVQGGMSAAAKHISGRKVENYYGDTRNPSHVMVTELADEIRRVVRTKVFNPKWIEGMKRHGYKGAGDISKRVGRVYGWECTTGEVDDWIFDDIARTFILNKEMRKFFEENNPWALEEISRRLLEAHQRELWNADPEVLEGLKNAYIEIESWLEEKMGDVQGDFQGGSVDVLNPTDVQTWKDKMKEVKKLFNKK